MYPRIGLTAILVLSLPGLAGSVELVAAPAIRAAAERAVRDAVPHADETLIVHVQELDPRLHLAACDAPLSANVGGDGQPHAHLTVVVRCPGSAHWTLYVTASVESQVPVLVAKHAMARESTPSPEDFEIQTRHLPGLASDYVTNPASLTRQALRQSLATGDALTQTALTAGNVIHRGQQVTLVAGGGSFEVRMNAVALSDGRIAERIRVQNLSSLRIVEGVVRSESVVEVPL